MPHPIQPIVDEVGRVITIKRQVVTQNSDLGETITYTTAARGTATTSVSGVIQPANSQEIIVAQQRGLEITHKVYFLEDPAVDERDRLEYTDGSTTTRTLLVKGQINFDEADEVWKVFCMEETDKSR